MAQPDPVVDAARKLLDDLMPLLKEKCRGGNDQPLELPGPPGWIPELDMALGTRRYKAVPMLFTAEQQCAARMLGELRAAGMRPLAQLERALAADPTVGPRLDHEVSSSGAGGQTWQGPSMVQLLVDRAISHAGGFDLEASVRNSLTTQWAEMLRRASDRMTVIVALHEFHAPAVPILLEPGVSRSMSSASLRSRRRSRWVLAESGFRLTSV